MTANDLLESNRQVAEALLVNDGERLDPEEAIRLLAPSSRAGTFIADTFGGVYYPDQENRQLDTIVANLQAMPPGPRRATIALARSDHPRNPRPADTPRADQRRLLLVAELSQRGRHAR